MILTGEDIFCSLPGSVSAFDGRFGAGLRCVSAVAQLLQAPLMRGDRWVNVQRFNRRRRLWCCSVAEGVLLGVQQFLVGVTTIVTDVALFLLVVCAVLRTIKDGPFTLERSALALPTPGFGLTPVQLLLTLIQRLLRPISHGLLAVTHSGLEISDPLVSVEVYLGLMLILTHVMSVTVRWSACRILSWQVPDGATR